MDVIFFICGTAILLVSGDLLVRAAIDVSIKMNVSPMVVGLTVIAFGTSAPELFIGIQATLNGFGGLAIGNIVGSNITNILLILGIPALVMAVKSSDKSLIKNYYYMLSATFIFIVFLLRGAIDFWQGLFLLLFLFVFIFMVIIDSSVTKYNRATIEPDLEIKTLQPWKQITFLALGFVGLPFGAELLITGVTSFAEYIGISEEVIGLTVVAVGTSLPELATSVSAAYRREVNLLLGNVIGSNMFNILGIAGAAALISPLYLSDKIEIISLTALTVVSIILAPFIIWRKEITRFIGIIFLLIYAAYIVILF